MATKRQLKVRCSVDSGDTSVTIGPSSVRQVTAGHEWIILMRHVTVGHEIESEAGVCTKAESVNRFCCLHNRLHS